MSQHSRNIARTLNRSRTVNNHTYTTPADTNDIDSGVITVSYKPQRPHWPKNNVSLLQPHLSLLMRSNHHQDYRKQQQQQPSNNNNEPSQ